MKPALAAVGVVLAGTALLEAVMQPSAGQRLEPFLLFVAMAAVTLAAIRAIPRLDVASRSLTRTVSAVGIVTATLVALATAFGAWRMFLSVHDLRLLAVMLAVAAALGVVFAASIAASLRADLDSLRTATDRVGAGDLTARTDLRRVDELGSAGRAIDEMVERLADAERQRNDLDRARRTLLAAISHDLRTPLTAVQAAVEALQDGIATDPSRYLRAMSHGIDHLSVLVDDLFLLARIEAGELDVEHDLVDLVELADETIEALNPLASGNGVVLRLDADRRVPVRGGPGALGRVMRNLVDNAIRHAPERSDVVVRVFNGDGATVEVLDSGPGFDPDTLDTVFAPFVRAEPSRNRDTGGSGLGLAIAKGVVEAHGGRIWADPGPGGRVSFHLPTT